MTRAPRLAAVAALVALCAACNNPMLDTLEQVVRQYTEPRILELSFADGSGIAPDSAIRLIYSESMDPASHVVGGGLAEASDGGLWSLTTEPNDTLTLTPTTGWPLGSGGTLTVVASDLEGYPAAAVSVSYGVLDGAVYVHPDLGDDGHPGTADQPKASIQAAVGTLERVFETGEVRIAAGTYQIIADTNIIVEKDVSLLGGYSATDWLDRDWASHVTLISHTALTGVVATISYGAGVSAGAVLEGLTISGPTATSSALVFCSSASPTIRNNILNVGGSDRSTGISISGGSPLIENNFIDVGGSALTAVGISLDSSGATIRGNTIRGDLAERFLGISLNASPAVVVGNRIRGPITTFQNWGMAVVSSDALIRNNVIDPGTMVNDADPYGCEGMVIQGAAPVIQNNIISGGDATSTSGTAFATAMSLLAGSTPVLENNLIYTVAGDVRTGIWQTDALSGPQRCDNNFFFGCPDGNYFEDLPPDYDAYLLDAAVFETYLDGRAIPAAGNVFWATHPSLDTDGRYTGTSPVEATEGGKDLSATFGVDFDGAPRTPPWSVGPFEKD